MDYNIDITEEIRKIFEDEVDGQIAHQAPPVAKGNRSQEAVKPVDKSTLFVDVNENPTKKGIRIQFALPLDKATPDYMVKLTQKLKAKLNSGLSKYNLSVDMDRDVPYRNVVGFIIDLEEVRLLIKSILDGKSEEQSPEEISQPESTGEGTI
jgi:hypothetical protein